VASRASKPASAEHGTAEAGETGPPRFTVDTRLFRELGELLVGRDSTALVELIKNAYDADATRVTVYGERLETESGFIVITDNGNGMTPDEFEDGFLRIASRSKETGDRRSPVYGRRFTGEKGVGRLAAHKLARGLEIQSVKRATDGAKERVQAHIDWERIEEHESLDDVGDALVVTAERVRAATPNGTEIALRRLREPWPELKIGQFLSEAGTFTPPRALLEDLPRRLLFAVPITRDASQGGDFKIEYAGDFEAGDAYDEDLLATAQWFVEIRATKKNIRYAINPSAAERQEHPNARAETYTIPHPDPVNGPFFDARILFRNKRVGSEPFRAWANNISGVRVYMEGFRVMPYGEPGNDWLGIDRDVGRRLRAFESLDRGEFAAGADDPSAALGLAASDSYVGGVFLRVNDAPRLRALVNREGFVPNDSFELLRHQVRVGVDLMARARAAGRSEARARRKAEREAAAAARGSGSAPQTSDVPEAVQQREAFREAVVAASDRARSARESLASGNLEAASLALGDIEAELSDVQERLRDLIREYELLPVLASIGLHMAQFVHEINGLLGLAQTGERAVEVVRSQVTGPGSRALRAQLGEAHRVLSDLRHRLERQAAYLIDVVTPDARRRRARQPLRERFDAALQLVARSAEQRGVRIRNEIPAELESPPMFRAELMAVFANLLTNAIKAAGDRGRIVASAYLSDANSSVFRLENTGIAVQLNEADRWFEPFQSTTPTVDPVLGQGMGLGLTITRTVLEQYGATIAFVEPTSAFGMKTAIEIDFRRQ
jgi:signal transduction histidine kinase